MLGASLSGHCVVIGQMLAGIESRKLEAAEILRLGAWLQPIKHHTSTAAENFEKHLRPDSCDKGNQVFRRLIARMIMKLELKVIFKNVQSNNMAHIANPDDGNLM
jgi:hypothetical protein